MHAARPSQLDDEDLDELAIDHEEDEDVDEEEEDDDDDEVE